MQWMCVCVCWHGVWSNNNVLALNGISGLTDDRSTLNRPLRRNEGGHSSWAGGRARRVDSCTGTGTRVHLMGQVLDTRYRERRDCVMSDRTCSTSGQTCWPRGPGDVTGTVTGMTCGGPWGWEPTPWRGSCTNTHTHDMTYTVCFRLLMLYNVKPFQTWKSLTTWY